MKNHKKLTAVDRGAIEVLLRNNYTPAQIARELGFNRSTISREINKRSTPNGYFAKYAQTDRDSKKSRSRRKCKISHSKTKNYILTRLERGWTPEQIAGRMRLEQREDYVCHETIYKYIYEDEYGKREHIYQYLPFARKKRKSWKGRGVHKSKIPNRVSIHKRPNIEGEFGHWEGDSVIYPYKKAINTMNELKTGLVRFTKLERKTALLTAKAMNTALVGYVKKTITLDNGSEFTNHELVSKKSKVDIYFCNPYSSWQRGANENVNRLLRKYLLKRYNINDLTQEELNDIAEELNNIPRKRLNYLTPAEAYQQEIYKLKFCCDRN